MILKDQFPPHQVITQHRMSKGHGLNSKLIVQLVNELASAYLGLIPTSALWKVPQPHFSTHDHTPVSPGHSFSATSVFGPYWTFY